jgi:hypothetical protein
VDVLVRPRHDRGAGGLRCGSRNGKIDILCDVQRSGGFDVSSRLSASGKGRCERVRSVGGFRIGPMTGAEYASHCCASPMGCLGVWRDDGGCSRAGRVRAGRRC